MLVLLGTANLRALICSNVLNKVSIGPLNDASQRLGGPTQRQGRAYSEFQPPVVRPQQEQVLDLKWIGFAKRFLFLFMV